MTLDIQCVSYPVVILSSEDMVESDLVQSGARGVSGNVATDSVHSPICIGNHNRCIPQNVTLNLLLYVQISGVRDLLLD